MIDTTNRKMVVDRNIITGAKDTPALLIQSLASVLTLGSGWWEVHTQLPSAV